MKAKGQTERAAFMERGGEGRREREVRETFVKNII